MSDGQGTDPTSLGWLARRPAIPLAAFFAAGVGAHSLLPHNAAALMAMTGVTVALAALALQVRFVCSALLAIAIALCGAGLAQREHYQYPAINIGLFAGDEPRLAEVQVRLIDEPRIISTSFGQIRPLPPKQVVTAEVVKVKTWAGWIDAGGETVLQIDQPHPRLDAGQVVRVIGMLQRPPPAANPGEFDWSDYYRQQRILATLSVPRIANVEILDDADPGPLTWLRLKTRRLLAMGFTAPRAIDLAVLRALLLGDHDPQMRDVQQEFENTGIGYQLSVSGLHVVLLAMFVAWLCRLCRVRPRYSLFITLVFVGLYGLVSLPSYSGARGIIFWIALGIATWTRRSGDRFQTLAVAVFLILLWHPMDLYAGGFQLSVVAVSAITLFMPRVRELALSWRDPDLVAAGHLYKPSFLENALSRGIALLTRALMYTLVGWFATFPLIALRFGQLSPWSILAGPALLPIVFVSLIGGLLKIVSTILWTPVAGTWAVVAGLPVILLRYAVDHLARLPGANIQLAAPPVWAILVYYVLLFLPLLLTTAASSRRRLWLGWGAPLVGVAGLFALPTAPTLQYPVDSIGNLRVTLLAVGAGQCAVIEPPGGQSVLFDAGSDSISDVLRKVIGPFLRSEGRREVDRIFLSHGDYDHMCAAAEIASAYGVREVLISPHFRRNSEGNLPDEALLETLDKLDLPPHIISTGDHVDLGDGVGVDVLWPPIDCNENSNNTGLVLRLTYAGKRILFPADIQDPALAGVLKHADQLPADVLVAPHHGSFESLTPAFLRAVHPAEIVASNAWRLTNKQKRFDEAAGQTPIFRTSRSGAITITIDSSGKITMVPFLKNAAAPTMLR